MSMTTVKTAEATGKALDWLVWFVERDMEEPPKPEAGVRIVVPPYDRLYAYRMGQPEGAMPGPDRLVATCRALAWAFFGDTAQVPSDLLG